jgi:hypothetical protein
MAQQYQQYTASVTVRLNDDETTTMTMTSDALQLGDSLRTALFSLDGTGETVADNVFAADAHAAMEFRCDQGQVMVCGELLAANDTGGICLERGGVQVTIGTCTAVYWKGSADTTYSRVIDDAIIDPVTWLELRSIQILPKGAILYPDDPVDVEVHSLSRPTSQQTVEFAPMEMKEVDLSSAQGADWDSSYKNKTYLVKTTDTEIHIYGEHEQPIVSGMFAEHESERILSYFARTTPGNVFVGRMPSGDHVYFR